jgi:hypothetical protein
VTHSRRNRHENKIADSGAKCLFAPPGSAARQLDARWRD